MAKRRKSGMTREERFYFDLAQYGPPAWMTDSEWRAELREGAKVLAADKDVETPIIL